MQYQFAFDIHLAALQAAVTLALPGKSYGLSSYGAARPIDIWEGIAFSGADQTTANAACAAHDPVFLKASKTAIRADGLDSVTVSVTAPSPTAAAVVLTVTSSAGSVDWPFALVNGAASDVLTALDPDTITITLKNPSNRSTDSLTITAV